jgi:O-antigen/teichoic acid export membrane protein
MGALSRLALRLGPYTASVALTFAVGVLSVPAIIALAGSQQWASLAIAQSIAAFATVLISFGWSTTGPNQIATLAAADRPAAFLRSAYARGALYLVAGPITAILCIVLTTLPPLAAIMAGVAYSLQGLGAVWYFVGESRPMRMLTFDAVPRALGLVVGILTLWITGSIVVFAATLLAAAIASLLVSYRAILRKMTRLERPRVQTIRQDLVTQRHGVLTTSAASLYYNSSLIVCSIFAPSAIEQYALVFKLYNYAGAALVPVLQMAQAWIPSAGGGALAPRVRAASLLALAAAVPLAIGSALLLPWAGQVLSLGAIDIPFALSVPIGVCIGAILVNQVVGQASLVAIGKVSALAWSATIGAFVGIALQLVGASAAGAIGLAMMVAATDIAVVTYQSVVVFSWLRTATTRPG